eukprot:TRINITY_DN33411_c0_g1_i1.p1 TRINITY_DN33411_c0_g1~~TRINITY_DN33411_c0_g1_i1.p1  ORF type:complete len:686 (-),score=138.34 TRINITY_DN33411_c0_g1_i1:110-2167(-)
MPREHALSPVQEAADVELARRPNALGYLRESLVSFGHFLGIAESGKDEENPECFQIMCEQGHVMSARIMREVYGPVCGTLKYNCLKCSKKVKDRHGCYRCHTCNVAYCMDCVKQMNHELLLDPAAVSAGDIILQGPFATVTHVILATSEMRPAEDFREILKVSEDYELFACSTIETTPLYADCVWKGRLHRAEYFFQRDPETGLVSSVGVRDHGSQEPPSCKAQEETKFIFHPFRRGHGGPRLLDEVKFEEAISAAEETLGGYGIKAVVKVFLDVPHQRASLDADRFKTAASKKALMGRLRRRWLRQPMCPSVAIVIWQRYFELLHKDEGDGMDAAAADDILQWMPLISDRSYPSNLVKVLTARKWIMRDDLFDAGPPATLSCASTEGGAEDADMDHFELEDNESNESRPASPPAGSVTVSISRPPHVTMQLKSLVERRDNEDGHKPRPLESEEMLHPFGSAALRELRPIAKVPRPMSSKAFAGPVNVDKLPQLLGQGDFSSDVPAAMLACGLEQACPSSMPRLLGRKQPKQLADLDHSHRAAVKSERPPNCKAPDCPVEAVLFASPTAATARSAACMMDESSRPSTCNTEASVVLSKIHAITTLKAEDVHALLLARAGVPKDVASQFLQQDIDGRALLELTEDDMKVELGVHILGHRKRVLSMVRQLVQGGLPSWYSEVTEFSG